MASNVLERMTLWMLEAEFASSEYFGKVSNRGSTQNLSMISFGILIVFFFSFIHVDFVVDFASAL